MYLQARFALVVRASPSNKSSLGLGTFHELVGAKFSANLGGEKSTNFSTIRTCIVHTMLESKINDLCVYRLAKVVLKETPAPPMKFISSINC